MFNTKFAILDCLQTGGLREDGSAELGRVPDYGSDTHCLGGVTTQVRMEEHTHGWEGEVTDCFELLLAVAGAGKRPVRNRQLFCMGWAGWGS